MAKITTDTLIWQWTEFCVFRFFGYFLGFVKVFRNLESEERFNSARNKKMLQCVVERKRRGPSTEDSNTNLNFKKF